MVEMEPLSLEVFCRPLISRRLRRTHRMRSKGAVIENTERGLVIVLHVGNERRILGQYRGHPVFRSFDGAAAAAAAWRAALDGE